MSASGRRGVALRVVCEHLQCVQTCRAGRRPEWRLGVDDGPPRHASIGAAVWRR
jgi:hypothetical protein